MDSKLEILSLSDITYNERLNEKQARKECAIALSHYRKNFNLYLKILTELMWQEWENPPHKQYKFAFSIILYSLLGTIQTIKTLTKKGYYFESNVIGRNFVETLGLCVFLKENPDKIEEWLNNKSNLLPAIQAFQLSTKIFMAPHSKELEKRSNQTYGHLCNYVHGNSVVNFYSVVDIVETEKGREISYKVPSRLKKKDVNGLWILSLSLIYCALYIFEDSLTKQQKIKYYEYLLNELKELDERLPLQQPIDKKSSTKTKP